MAVANYHSAFGRLPPAVVRDSDGNPMHSWRVLILPYFEYGDLYDQYDFSVPWNHPNNARLQSQVPTLYRIPGSTDGVETNYLAIVGPGSAFDSPPHTHASLIADGSSTLMIVENNDRYINWMQPEDLSLDDALTGVGVAGGITSAFAEPAGVTVDDSVLTLAPNLGKQELHSLLVVPLAPTASPTLPSGASEIQDGRLRDKR